MTTDAFEERPPAKATEAVDHPAHYGGADDPFETIKVLRAWLPTEEFRGFLRGNVIKYQSRLGKKAARREDAAKAAWYAQALADFEREEDRQAAIKDAWVAADKYAAGRMKDIG